MNQSTLIFLVTSLLTICCLDTHAEFTIRSREIAGTNYLHLNDIVEYFGFHAEFDEKKIYLANSHDQIVLPVGKRTAYLNSIVAQLSFAPRLDRHSYFISKQDFLLLIDPLVRDDSLPKHPINRIILDPGHGGMDSGAIGAKFFEKNVNIVLAKKLGSLLEAKGYAVHLTRTDDTFMSLTQRGRIASSWKADLFISIHCNAAPKKYVTGIETYLVTPKGSRSSSQTNIQTNAVPGNAFDLLNARFAYEIQKNLIQTTGASDRGIKYYRWQVLREARCPAVLIEAGFLSSLNEEKKLGTPEYQNQLVFAISKGITDFHNTLKR